MILKVRNLKHAQENLELAINSLYILEDLNDYRKNSLNLIIKELNKIKLKVV
jgi:hypothetical protein